MKHRFASLPRLAILLAAPWFLSAGTGRAEEGPPRIVAVGAVAPDIIGITVEAGRCVPGRQEAYARREGDTVERSEDPGNGVVRRDGKLLGALVGPRADVIRYFDAFEGRPLDLARADRNETYTITSPDDPAGSAGMVPTAVHRKSKPRDMARVGPWEFRWPMVHVLYLKLPAPLVAGTTYSIDFADDLLPRATWRHSPDECPSEAVHVTQVGFHPDDPAKVAFLSSWLGTGGALPYREGTGFRVLEQATGAVAHEGRIALSKAASARDEDPYGKNYSGTDVYLLDFSGLDAPGTYRVAVDGIGCSLSFEIGPEVWRRAFVTSARGLYHQRSGIELGPPWTEYRRPRAFHPDHGLRVLASTCPLLDSGNGLNALGTDRGNFGNLVRGRTDEIVPDAWGGYFDAGDWDRRIQHLEATRLLLELVEIFPEFAREARLDIPESGNGIPDLFDEALWNIDFFRRLQTPGGGIRGGIESTEHPRLGEASWQESLPVLAYAPDPWCSFLFAADAARAAALLQAFDAPRAGALLASAVRAADWGEAEIARMAERKLPHPVRDARNLAGACLFAATGEARWHDLFLATTAFGEAKGEAYTWQSHDQRDAAFVYSRLERPGVDERIRANARSAIVREADVSVAFGANTAFRWTKRNPWEPFNGGKASVPQVIPILRAHALTGDGKYLRAAVLAAQSGAGANPANLCYTTGVGHRSPLHPLVVDAHVMGVPPPPGITVYGPSDMERIAGDFAVKLLGPVMHPPPGSWPAMEAWVDVFLFPVVTEFTVMETLGPNAYAWGYLAAARRSPGVAGERVDHRHWALDSWIALIGLPDDAFKCAVDADGRFLAEIGGAGRQGIYPDRPAPRRVSIEADLLGGTVRAESRLLSPRAPIAVTRKRGGDVAITEHLFLARPLDWLSAPPGPGAPRESLPDRRQYLLMVDYRNEGDATAELAPIVRMTGAEVSGGEDPPGDLRTRCRPSLGIRSIERAGPDESVVALEPITLEPGRTARWVLAIDRNGYRGGQVEWAEAEALRDAALAYWEESTGLPYEVIRVPDPEIQALLETSIREIHQMRYVVRGLPAYFFGPGCYNDYWILDGSFIGEALAMLGLLEEASGYADYLLLHQQEDGRIQCMARHWKETGIALVTLHRHARLSGDREWLVRRWLAVRRAVEAIGALRRTVTDPDAPNFGLAPVGFGDGGIGDEAEYTNNHWLLAGVRAAVEAARWLDRAQEAEAWEAELRDFEAVFRRAIERDAKVDARGNRYIPAVMGPASPSHPTRGQWAFCQGVYPGRIFPKDDPLMLGTLRMLAAHEVQGGMIEDSGWLGIWPQCGSFYGHDILWLGDGRKAARLLQAFANHSSPFRNWREEMPRQTRPGEIFPWARGGGDMPHVSASAEFIRLVGHLLAFDREDELHLLEGLPPGWLGPGMATRLRGLRTPFGTLGMELAVASDGKAATLRVALEGGAGCRRVIVHAGGWSSPDLAATLELSPDRPHEIVLPLR